MNEEPGVTKDQLFCVIVYKGLEHPWILVYVEFQNLSPVDTKE